MDPTLDAVTEDTTTRDPKTGRFLKANRQTFVAGHTVNETHGVRRFQQHGFEAVPLAIRQKGDTFISQAITDLGGLDNLSAIQQGYIKNLARVFVIIELLSAYIETNGATTIRGRQRSAVPALLSALSTYDKLANRLGLERRPRKVKLSISDVLNAPDDAPVDISGHEPGEVD